VGELAALKALAHPRRQRVLHQLTVGGPATSAELARVLELNTGATSYHLRELARYGFIEEAPAAEGAHVRERRWQAARRDLRFPTRSEQTPEIRAVLNEINRQAFAADLETFARYQARADELGEWGEALPYSRGTIAVTPGELREFFEEYIALLNRYKRASDQLPEGARVVLTRLLAFPDPGEPEPQPEPEPKPEP
jgi:DNA-binding transcriptional ArsR family regulator